MAALDPIHQALQHHQSGRLQEAEKLYREILSKTPEHPDANHLLGVLANQSGFPKVGIAHISTAIRSNAKPPMFHNSLGLAYVGDNRFDEAIKSFKNALKRQRDYPDAHFNLAGAYLQKGAIPNAIKHFRRVISLKPDHMDAHGNLGNALKQKGDFEGAVACYETVIKAQPQRPEAHCNLGVALQELGQTEQALAAYRRAIDLKPDYMEAYNNLAQALQNQGQWDEAIDCLQKALSLQPDFTETHSNLGIAYMQKGHPAEAQKHLQEATRLAPGHATAESNLGAALIELGYPRRAITHFKKALELRPHFPTAYSNLLLSQLYLSETNPKQNSDLARRFTETIPPNASPLRSSKNNPDPDRPLKIGFVSADLRHHSVSYFLEAVWPLLNSDSLEVHAYATSPKEDDMSRRLESSVSVWRNLAGLSIAKQAHTIQKDNIDILVDLGGHTAHNSLPLFAAKPAPLQVTWLGYSATTGLGAMDYILCDPWVLPESEEDQYSETPWRMPETYLCFSPPQGNIAIAELPALNNGYITFGSFNNLSKLTDAAIHCWAQILRKTPDSRLMLKAKQLDQADYRSYLHTRFASEGIEADRLTFLERTQGLAEHLSTYNKIDMALDTFPYGGTTTTAEALWMGVPVLTMKGNSFVSHVGESLLQNSGLTRWIAQSPDDYVEKAVAAARDLSALSQLRQQLRDQFVASPVCDAPRFTAQLETAFRSMWNHHCTARNN